MKKIIAFVIILAALLIGQRMGWGFARSQATGVSVSGRVLAVDGTQTSVAVNDELKRRQTIETQDATFVLFEAVPGVRVALDERTQVRLDLLEGDRVALRLGRGRIVVLSEDLSKSVVVKTNQTESQFTGGWVTFVNYDFKDEISILPEETTVATYLKLTDLTLSSEGPVAIHESHPVKYGVTMFSTESESVARFYDWADSMMPPPSISSPE